MSSSRSYLIQYPRRQFIRYFMRFIFRPLLRLCFRLEITGTENWPKQGNVLVVGNHSAYIEAALMTAFTPKLIEVLTASDVPPNPATDWLVKLYAEIPIQRGKADRKALRMALDVLEQGGWVGLFPEGGIWETRKRTAQTGVAWLSMKANAPVVPVGFGGVVGALTQMVRLKRPRLTMNIGQPLPPVTVTPKNKQAQLQAAADEILETVYRLLPEAEQAERNKIVREDYSAVVSIQDVQGKVLVENVLDTDELSAAFGQLAFTPILLRTVNKNYKTYVKPLMTHNVAIPTAEMQTACDNMTRHLSEVDQTYLIFRFGKLMGDQMAQAIAQIGTYAAQYPNATVTLQPKWTYQLRDEDQIYVDTQPQDTHKM